MNVVKVFLIGFVFLIFGSLLVISAGNSYNWVRPTGGVVFLNTTIWKTNWTGISNGTHINASGIYINNTFIDDWGDINNFVSGDSLWIEDGDAIKPDNGQKVKVEDELIIQGGGKIMGENGNIIFQTN